MAFFLSFLLEKGRGTLREQVVAIKLILEELRSKKREKLKEFSEVQSQIDSLCSEIAGSGQSKSYVDPQIHERDLTAKKLGELKLHLQELQNEKVAISCRTCLCVCFVLFVFSPPQYTTYNQHGIIVFK